MTRQVEPDLRLEYLMNTKTQDVVTGVKLVGERFQLDFYHKTFCLTRGIRGWRWVGDTVE